MSATLPKFITFTGIDGHTPVNGMLDLARRYPIEWGVLFSPKRQGAGRYPPLESLDRILRWDSLRLSAHVCGGHSRELIEMGGLPALEQLIANHFGRVQVNTVDPVVDPDDLWGWAGGLGCRAILQTRDAHMFPANPAVDWLFDASGGRGISPGAWPEPQPFSDALVGYAGGLNPGNVAAAVAVIGELSSHYWIDMESGVRDENDRFDLGKCRAVCEAVYGARA